jgi:hypothetical protein
MWISGPRMSAVGAALKPVCDPPEPTTQLLIRQLQPFATRGSRHIVGVRDGIDHTDRVPPGFNVYQFAARSDFGSSAPMLVAKAKKSAEGS